MAVGRTKGRDLDARDAFLWQPIVKCRERGAWAKGTCAECMDMEEGGPLVIKRGIFNQ